MLASLQLFNHVPTRIMDLVIFMVTHPDFDPEQVTLRDAKDIIRVEKESQRKGWMISEGVSAYRRSLDVIRTAEQCRMRERMAAVHARSQPRLQTRLNWAGFPFFVLDEVLDIIKAERQAGIEASFEKPFKREKDMDDDEAELEEDVLLSNLSLVHRSWTIPAQKALGQVVWIYTRMKDLRCRRRAVEGPWTSVVAITLRDHFNGHHRDPDPDSDCEPDSITYSYHYDSNDSYSESEYQRIKYRKQEQFENYQCLRIDFLHGFLLSLPILKRIYVRSYDRNFASKINVTIKQMICQNKQLEELTLYSSGTLFLSEDGPARNFNSLLESDRLLKNLKTLKLQGDVISAETSISNVQTTLYPSLRSLSLFSVATELLPIVCNGNLENLSIRTGWSSSPFLFDPLPLSIRCLDLCFDGPLAFVRLSELYSEEENRAPNALGRLPRNLEMFEAGEILYGMRMNIEVWLEYLLCFPFSARFPLIEAFILRFHFPDRNFENGANMFRDKMEAIAKSEGFLLCLEFKYIR